LCIFNKKNTNKAVIDRIVKSCVAIILKLNGQLSIVELSNNLKINRRQLERKFTKVIGVSPKQLSKIIRLQATLKMIANNKFASLTSVSYNGNYYDQTHFIKDFREFTGVNTKEFYSKFKIIYAVFRIRIICRVFTIFKF